MADYKIIYPSNITYSCICCGSCCERWQIQISEAEAQRFSADDWPGILKLAGCQGATDAGCGVYQPREEVSVELKKSKYLSHKTSLKYNLKMQKNGRCIFLDANSLCAMHAARGIDYKAFTCKSFPVKFLYLPGNIVQLSYSFFCPGVVNNSNALLDEAFIKKLIEEDNDKTIVSDVLEISDGVEIDFSAMLLINHFISDFMFAENNASHLNDIDYCRDESFWNKYSSAMTLDKRMAVALYMVIFMAKLASKLRGEDPLGYLERFKSEISNREALKKLIERSCEIYDAAQAKNYAPLILMAFISLHQISRKEISNFKRIFIILSNMLKCSMKMGSFTMVDLDVAISFKALASVKFDIDNIELSSFFEKYISHIIYRKISFFSSNVIKAYQYIALFYSLVKWYSKIFAAVRKDSVVNIEDLRKAISFMEKNFVGHSMLLQVLETNKNFDNIFNPIFSNYAIIKSLTI